MVAYAYHDGLDFAEGGVADDGYAVVGLVGVVAGVELVVADVVLVAELLELDEHVEVEVEHIAFGPYLLAVFGRVVAVFACGAYGSELEGHFVLVVVVAVVGAEAYEDGDFAVAQVGVVCVA